MRFFGMLPLVAKTLRRTENLENVHNKIQPAKLLVRSKWRLFTVGVVTIASLQR